MIIDEDFINYKEAAMFIGTTRCSGKCCTEANIPFSVCQNAELKVTPTVDIPNERIIYRYQNNPITRAIVFGGLEPFEQFDELVCFIDAFRAVSQDDVIIYTGYYPDEIRDCIGVLKEWPNIIIKFGRYVPNKASRYDSILGINLISDNQYAEKVS